MAAPLQEKPAPRKSAVTTTKKLLVTRTHSLRLRRQRRARWARTVMVLAFSSLILVGLWGMWRSLV